MCLKITELTDCPNTILTPHIGGSTEEAQFAIAIEVAEKFVEFFNEGTTLGCVNLPTVFIPPNAIAHRITNFHQNKPGVLKAINNILADYNVVSQIVQTKEEIGYIIADVDRTASHRVILKIKICSLLLIYYRYLNSYLH